MADESEVQNRPGGKTPGPELRLLDRRAFVGFPPLPLGGGVSIVDFALQIPDVSFPFDVSAGPGRYQRRRLAFGSLELRVEAEAVARALATLSGKLGELDQVKVHFRPGVLEVQAHLVQAERAPLTFKIAFDGDGEQLAVYVYDVRLYAFSPTPAPLLPLLLTRALTATGLLPDVEVRGGTGFSTSLLGSLTQRAAVSRGYKVPHLDDARLAAAEISPRGLLLRFASGGLPPPSAPDEELLLTLEGARAFADAEALLARGEVAEAREAYLRAGDVTEAHPFAAERLLQLLVADPTAHELAIDIAASLTRRRDRSPVAMWAEAVVRERRGESARAAERFLALCAHARRNGEEASAFFAAEAAARASRDFAPQVAVRALHEVLGLRPDHLPSLQALARAADQAGDRVGAIRAWRRIAALARDTEEAASAHVHLARLSAQTEDDVAGARLHCEAALRLTPDHPEALLLLGELCHRSGEHLRALKALDRLRDVGLARHELDRVAQAAILAGRVWEKGLEQPENALLRYREAVGLLPDAPVPHAAVGRIAESLGRVQEAIASYVQAIELAGPSPSDEEARRAAHESHHAMARLARSRLGDPARARGHLESALALEPEDVVALEALIPFFRATGRVAELAECCERAGRLSEDPQQRAALWAEAGELYRTRLSDPDRAEQWLTSALEVDPRHRPALEGLLSLAESRRDGATLTRCLKTLAELAEAPEERLRLLRRLSVAARDLSFDLELAVESLRGVLAIEPEDPGALAELCALQRKRGDMGGLADALEARARVAETSGDKRLAAAALRELAQVYESRLGRTGEALVALEKAARLVNEPAVLMELADLSLRADRPEHARSALEDVLASLPRTASQERIAELRARLGQACEQLGELDAAREHYAVAFPLRRLDAELANRLERLYLQAGEERALAELRATRAQALAAAGRSEEAAPLFVQSAEGLISLGESGAARARLEAALEAVPEGAQAARTLELLSNLALQQGDRAEASRLLAKKADLLSDDAAAAELLVRASALCPETGGQLDLLEAALKRAPSHVEARLRRAELRAEHDAEGALEDLGVVLSPMLEEGAEGVELELLRRAAALAASCERWDLARRYLTAYSDQRPEDLPALLELASLHRRAGARSALSQLLGALWPRLEGEDRLAARREHIALARELGESEEAQRALRSMLAELPGDRWAAGALLELLEEEAPGAARDPSTLEEAVREERLDLLSILIGDPARADDHAALRLQRARLRIAADRLQEAREDLELAARASASPAPLQRELAGLYRRLEDAPAELSAWIVLLDAAPDDREEALTRIDALSEALVGEGALDTARQGYRALCAQPLEDARRTAAFRGLARTLVDDPAAAAEALLEASRQGPLEARLEVLLERAELLEGLGDSRGAAEALYAVLELAPAHAAARARLREVLAAQGDHAALAELIATEAEAATGPEASALFRELGELCEGPLEDPARAEAAFVQAARHAPEDAELRLRVAELRVARGATAEALEMFEQAADALEGEAAGRVRWRGAQLAQSIGASDVALRLARRAHEVLPAAGAELSLLAELLYLRGATAEALPLQAELAARVDLEEAADEGVRALLRLAELSEQVGDVEQAEAALRRIWKHAPDNVRAAEDLSRLLWDRAPREAIEVLHAHAQAHSEPARSVALRVELAERAQTLLGDGGLAATLLGEAAALAEDPLPIHEQRVTLFREAGRSSELLEALQQVAELAAAQEAGDRAREALLEGVTLAESLGRTDTALTLLETLRDASVRAEDPAGAAAAELQRAHLLRDVRLELDAAAEAYGRAYALAPSLQLTQEAAALAERRGADAERVRWLSASLAHLDEAEAQADVHLSLAVLQRDALGDADAAEASFRAALEAMPRNAAAEDGLEQLLRNADRLGELARYWEDVATATEDVPERSRLLRRAATLYRDEVGDDAAAVVALWAARTASPDDHALTRELADLLHALGRGDEASDFDAQLLAADPFLPEVFERHRAWLEESDDAHGLAGLMLGRAQAQQGQEAADSFLVAADALRRVGAIEQAQLCEESAFERAPGDPTTLERLRQHPGLSVRRQAELLGRAAEALDGEAAIPLLAERARHLLEAGEALLAAEALDDWLARAPDDLEALALRGDVAAQAGGPQASQPYDRRLLDVGGAAAPVRVRAAMRLGHASMASGALQDAAGAFEMVLDVATEPGHREEALSVLSEVHARRGDTRGVFQTTLMLAQTAEGEEAEALYRRAADVLDSPVEALDALLPLAKLRPSDVEVVERAAEGLRALARSEELVALYEQGAAVCGGTQAARWLLRAAETAGEILDDADRALALAEQAVAAAPDDHEALSTLHAAYVRRGRSGPLKTLLPRLIAQTSDVDRAFALRLELAQLTIDEGARSEAIEVLSPIVDAGPEAPGYDEALSRLEVLRREEGEPVALAKVLELRADRVEGPERATYLRDAAKAHLETEDVAAAMVALERAVEVHPQPEALLTLADLKDQSGAQVDAARLRLRAAEHAGDEEAARLTLAAADTLAGSGEHEEARTRWEAVHARHPELLPALAFAERLQEIGEVARALELARPVYEAEGRHAELLSLADAAQDADAAKVALRHLVRRVPGNVSHVERLASMLRSAGDWEELLELAGHVDEQAPSVAAPLLDEVLFKAPDVDLRVRALRQQLAREQNEGYLLALLPRLSAPELAPLAEVAVAAVHQRPLLTRPAALMAAADALPEHRPALLDALVKLHREHGRPRELDRALALRIETVTDATERAELRTERAALQAGVLDVPERARETLEEALDEVPDHLPALEALLPLLPLPQAAARFAEVADALYAHGATDVLALYPEQLADAYEHLGRFADADGVLARLEETDARIERRAVLAERQNLTGEALILRERLARTPEAQEAILRGFLDARLVPFAVRLATSMREAGALDAVLTRHLAESLAQSEEGASFAALLWPELLRAEPADVEGWRLFAHALRTMGLEMLSLHAEGLMGALSDAQTPADPVSLTRVEVEHPSNADWTPAPVGSAPLTEESAPRLHAVLGPALESLSIRPVRPVLDLEGGVEAWLAQDDTLVIGAGALSVFGPVELTFLSAVALALGPEGSALMRPGPVEELAMAARHALRAVPSTLAACRVAAQLSEEVRGGDPAAVRAAEVLRTSELLPALAAEILDAAEVALAGMVDRLR